MTEHERPEQDDRSVRERLISTQCRACGGDITYFGTGRRPRYCSPSCRQTGWALRRAAEQLQQADPRPTVVREVVARERVQTVRVAGRTPRMPEDWARHLEALTAQLSDPESFLATMPWQHQRLAYTLTHALAALDRAHPGGIDFDQLPVRLQRPEPPG